jgi:hypothetical protein
VGVAESEVAAAFVVVVVQVWAHGAEGLVAAGAGVGGVVLGCGCFACVGVGLAVPLTAAFACEAHSSSAPAARTSVPTSRS